MITRARVDKDRMWKVAALAGAMVPNVAAHGAMVWPPNWFDANGEVGLKSYGQCSPGSTGQGFCMWFTNETFIPGKPTLSESLHTYKQTTASTRTPWLAPGTAPIDSPCGVAGGNMKGCPIGGPNPSTCQGGGFAYGPAAETVAFPNVVTTEWTAGGTAEVGWGIKANHGGGYSYRICPVPPKGQLVTEECFQKHPLDFDGDTQWVQFGTNGSRIEFLANRTREGTFPAGSQWTKDPIPACAGKGGGNMNPYPTCGILGTQFPAPAPGLQGFGENTFSNYQTLMNYTIMDRVRVPKIAPGEYVLSFRWDCEQTPQVWNTCASIRIV